MIDSEKIIPIIKGYKEYFPVHWKDEKYKWEAVKHFQENWDIDAENFGEMFKKATEKTSNLLGSGYAYPRGMILEFAKADDNAVREMFRRLYDESRDLSERVTAFMDTAEELRNKYNDGTRKQHYQNTNYISTYLWLMYPDKYYIYKYELYKAVADELDDSYQPKRNGSVETMVSGFRMYDEIRDILQEDYELRQMLNDALTDDCYTDPKMNTSVIDFGFYIARFYKSGDAENDSWFPKPEEYTPGISVENWVSLINDPKVFNENSLAVINAFYDIGGQATCSELAEKYGYNAMHYSAIVNGLASRINKKTGCHLVEDGKNENAKWWPILFVGKYADKQQKGVYIWRLRDELKMALEQKKEYCNDNHSNAPVIWKISHGTNSTGVPEELRETLEKRKVVTLHRYTKPLATSNISQGESFITQIKSGDYFYLCYGAEIVLFGQFLNGSPKPNHEMAEQYNADNWYEREYKLIAVSKDRNKYNGVKKWWTSNQNSTCVKVTDNALFEELILEPYFGLKLSDLQTGEYHEPYTKEDFLKDVFITGSEYDKLRALVLRKKNIILQGAPGVGKTFSAKRLAYSIIGEKNENRICMVQFHQNYSYEDFIMGYRPNDSGGFELQNGVFYNFCIRCQENPDKPYFFIIDEINRGNLSKIFGELLMLIETDKRGEKHKLNLVYGGTAFYIPENLHIIGMMNTADRSLAMIDYALRRRFSFYTMQPAFDNAADNGFEDYTKKISCELYHTIISKIMELNNTIRKDTTLGKGFEIGHSYFAPEDVSVIDDEWVRNVVEYEIIPLIEEYWFDNDKMLGEWTKTLYQAIGEEK